MHSCGLTAILLCLLMGPDDLRTWTDSTGKYKIEARLIDVTKDLVLLRKPDGAVVTLHIEQLSKTDKRFAMKHSGDARTSASLGMSLTELSDLVERSVVQIETHDSIGSGFVVGSRGYVITNHHVIEGARWAKVTFHDKRFYEVSGVVGQAPRWDMAVLRLKLKHDHPSLPIRKDEPSKGEQVAAFGAPKGLSFSVSDGIISSVRPGRELEDQWPGFHRGMKYDPNMTWIQTTAPISGGNSGGPLVDMQGRVVGINTWTRAGDNSQNLNFAISWKDINELLKNLNSKARPLRDPLNTNDTVAGTSSPSPAEAKPKTPSPPSPPSPPLAQGPLLDESDDSGSSALDVAAITPAMPTVPTVPKAPSVRPVPAPETRAPGQPSPGPSTGSARIPFGRMPTRPSSRIPGRPSPPSMGGGAFGGKAYESFAYTSIGAKLAGQGAGQGFRGPWKGIRGTAQLQENYVIAEGTLEYPNLPTNGNRISTRSVSQIAGLSRGILRPVHSNGVRYFSFLIRPEGTLGEGALNGFFGVYISHFSNMQNSIFVGASGATDTYVIEQRGGQGRVSSNVKAEVGQTAFLVVKAELGHGGQTRFTLYVNPNPTGREPRSGTVKDDINLSLIWGLGLYSTGAFSFDELRIGRTWAEVTGAN